MAKQDLGGHVFLLEAIRKAIEARQLLVAAGGKLLIIQTTNVKYVELDPAPDQFPEGVIRRTQLATNPAPLNS